MLQERFLLHTTSSDTAGNWWVPVTYALKEEYIGMKNALKAPVKAWLGPGQTLAVDLDDGGDIAQWLLVNLDRRGKSRFKHHTRALQKRNCGKERLG